MAKQNAITSSNNDNKVYRKKSDGTYEEIGVLQKSNEDFINSISNQIGSTYSRTMLISPNLFTNTLTSPTNTSDVVSRLGHVNRVFSYDSYNPYSSNFTNHGNFTMDYDTISFGLRNTNGPLSSLNISPTLFSVNVNSPLNEIASVFNMSPGQQSLRWHYPPTHPTKPDRRAGEFRVNETGPHIFKDEVEIPLDSLIVPNFYMNLSQPATYTTQDLNETIDGWTVKKDYVNENSDSFVMFHFASNQSTLPIMMYITMLQNGMDLQYVLAQADFRNNSSIRYTSQWFYVPKGQHIYVHLQGTVDCKLTTITRNVARAVNGNSMELDYAKAVRTSVLNPAPTITGGDWSVIFTYNVTKREQVSFTINAQQNVNRILFELMINGVRVFRDSAEGEMGQPSVGSGLYAVNPGDTIQVRVNPAQTLGTAILEQVTVPYR